MSKPNLPEFPLIPWKKLGAVAPDSVSAEAIYDYATAYAEQAVRQALAEQKPVAWMTEDGRVSTDETKRSAMPNSSKVAFCIPLALIPGADKDQPCSPTSSTGQSQ